MVTQVHIEHFFSLFLEFLHFHFLAHRYFSNICIFILLFFSSFGFSFVRFCPLNLFCNISGKVLSYFFLVLDFPLSVFAH